jgi:FecR-like protein
MIKKIVCFLFLFSAFFVYAENFTSAQLIYFEGDIEIQRNNEILETDDIYIGFEIEEFDLISTSSDGYAELEVDSSVSAMILMKIEPDSSLYFQVKKEEEKKNFDLKMVSGNIFLKVNKLLGRDSMNITSKSAVMGIRGTELYIKTAPEGSLLVACPEGSVSCKSSTGGELFAGNGKAVEMLYGQPIKSKSVSSDLLTSYMDEWSSERERVFKSMSFSVIKPVAIQYKELYKRFDAAYIELIKYKDVLGKYTAGESNFSNSVLMKDKIQVSPSVIMMRSSFYLFEQQFYRVKELKRYFDEDPVKGKISKKYSVADFMKDYGKEYRDNLEKMAFARASLKAFSAMQVSGMGTGSLMDDIFSGNPLLE